MKNFPRILVFLFVATISDAFATPAVIMIIRHAEKPPNAETAGKNGTFDDPAANGLSPRGKERAARLALYFTRDPKITNFGIPNAIFAMNPKKSGGSVRAIDTVTPLSQRIGVPIDTDFERDAYKKMANTILSSPAYDGKVVLICWEHKVIRDLVDELNLKLDGEAPKKWPDDSFDRTWVFVYGHKKAKQFYDVPQHLLPGDGAT